MNVDAEKLPDDPAVLKKTIANLTKEYEKKIYLLEEEIAFWRKKLFGRSSEKLTNEDETQGRLFDEAETHATASKEEMESEEVEENKTISASPTEKSKKRGRKRLPTQ